MKLAVIGTGYVGLVSGVCLHALGHEVTCIDRDTDKITQLKAGKAPIYEPGLETLLNEAITYTTSLAEGIAGADIIMIAVGTPPEPLSGMPDVATLYAVIDELSKHASAGQVVVVKSTVPIGTTTKLQAKLPKLHLASNPEFLREGRAIADFMHPDRIVIGTHSTAAKAALETLYAPLTTKGFPLFATTPESSEMIKYAANSMLAMKVSFINEMADLCDALGANVLDVATGIGMDRRIGKEFLKPGPGIGGSCFPKDTLGLSSIAKTVGIAAHMVEAVIASNEAHMRRMVDKIIKALGGNVTGKAIGALGLTFKPATDDMREAASLSILPPLVAAGARVRAYDPEGMAEAKKLMPQLNYANSAAEVIAACDSLVVLTEWEEFRSISPAVFGGKTVIDLRNLYTPQAMQTAGVRYIGLGV